MRSVFFVPRPGLLSGDDLAHFEAEAASNTAAKGNLLRHVHVGCAHLHSLCQCLLFIILSGCKASGECPMILQICQDGPSCGKHRYK